MCAVRRASQRNGNLLVVITKAVVVTTKLLRKLCEATTIFFDFIFFVYYIFDLNCLLKCCDCGFSVKILIINFVGICFRHRFVVVFVVSPRLFWVDFVWFNQLDLRVFFPIYVNCVDILRSDMSSQFDGFTQQEICKINSKSVQGKLFSGK